MIGACDTQILISKSFKYYCVTKVNIYEKERGNFVFNSMVQDLEEFLWAGLVKESFLMVMKLKLIFERMCVNRIYLYSFGRILRKTFPRKGYILYRGSIWNWSWNSISAHPMPPSICPSLLCLIFCHSPIPPCTAFIGLCCPLECGHKRDDFICLFTLLSLAHRIVTGI